MLVPPRASFVECGNNGKIFLKIDGEYLFSPVINAVEHDVIKSASCRRRTSLDGVDTTFNAILSY